MDLFAKSFTFAGTTLSDEYFICTFESPSTTYESSIKRSTNTSDITPYRSTTFLYGSQYQDVMKFNVSLTKPDKSIFSPSEVDSLVNWLLGPMTYQDFTVLDFDGEKYHENIIYHAFCTGYDTFRVGTAINGMIFSFECDAPYGYAPTETTNFSSTTSTTIKINNTSDELVDYYPLIKIKSNATGKITLKTDKYPSEVMELQVLQNQELAIDNESGTITDNMELFSFEDDFNLTWIHLAPGENTITITGNVTGSIECTYIRKRGV